MSKNGLFPGLVFSVTIICFILISCNKDSGGSVNVNQKPGVGTKWTYRYTTYYPNGGQISSSNIVYKAVSQETLGGENWLKIVDTASNTTVFYLKEKSDGLYLFANSSANLLCKYPAALNETYTAFNGAETVDFIVSWVNISQQYGQIGDIMVNLYNGSIGADLVDEIWYNSKYWITRRNYYIKPLQSATYFRNASLIIQNITY